MTTIVCTNDLLDRSRFAAAIDDLEVVAVDALVARVDEAPPAVVIIDLTIEGAVGAIGSIEGRVESIVGFGPHVDEETLAAGRDAGCTEVVARSVLFRRLRAG